MRKALESLRGKGMQHRDSENCGGDKLECSRLHVANVT
jgi:hypothetical protein